MTTLDIMKEATVRAYAVKDAAVILRAYPELLAAEPKLAEFVRLIEVRQSDLDRQGLSLPSLDKSTAAEIGIAA